MGRRYKNKTYGLSGIIKAEAYFVYYPKEFYIAYFSVRADDFDASIMTGGIEVAKRALEEINQRKTNGTATQKDENMITCVSVKMSLEKITTANILVKFLEADK